MLYKLPQLLKAVVLYSFLFLAFGSLLEAVYSPRQRVASVVTPTALAVPAEQAVNMPKTLVIPRLGITLSIVPGQYDPATKTWTLSDTDVQFAGMTALPNDRSGNTLLYGHNTSEVLAPTDRLVEGDIAQVATQDGRTYTYAFTSGRQVDPTDTSVLKQTSISPTLTLLTCDGFWDEKRRLMEFSFVSVK
jgi:LPXTG-site transpeptidase (sortase) family protein